MSKYRLRCPDCRRVFPWQDTSSLPDYCPLCGSYVGIETPADGTFVPKAPAIGRSHDSPNAVYRQMETASIARAEQAADMLGVSKSETAHMKITNMKDNAREGESAAISRPNPVSQLMQQYPQQVAVAQAQGAAYAAATRSGPYPGAGDAVRQMVNSVHDQTRRAVEQQVEMGRY